MRDYNRNKRNDRGSNRGGGGFRNRESFDRPQMHTARCAECGQSCEVPFRPTGDKPVYCRNCFSKRNDRDDRNSRNDRYERNDRSYDRYASKSDERQMYSAICDTCSAKCELPFKPTGNKPVYCSDCFEQHEKGANRETHTSPDTSANNLELQKQLDTINSKLDRLIRALAIRGKIEESDVVEETIVEEKPKTTSKSRAKTKARAKNIKDKGKPKRKKSE